MKALLYLAIDRLAKEFSQLNWTFLKDTTGDTEEVISYWPGKKDEDIMICVLKEKDFHEVFHRQDFFFFNYAYQRSYQALSSKYNNLIDIREGECYIGQPYSGYALRGSSEKDIIIVGILIRKETFFREYLPALASNAAMFRFFLDPQTNKFSDEFIHLAFPKSSPVRSLLEMMILEYADRREDTQAILKPLVLALFMHIARRYKLKKPEIAGASLSDQILQYMGDHPEAVTLKDIATQFSYHPNYISTLLHKETGRTFSELLLEKRMERARILLNATDLSIEEIAVMLGYSNSSNFYKAFRGYYGVSPREYFAI